MMGKAFEYLASILAFIFLLYTTITSIAVIFSNAWFVTSDNLIVFSGNIGLTCNPETLQGCDLISTVTRWAWDWDNLFQTSDQKAVFILLWCSFAFGVLALFFICWSLVCFCCLLTAGGVIASIFSILQFFALLSAVLVFASEWGWKAPPGMHLGAAYICAIIAIPLSFLAALLAFAHHRSSASKAAKAKNLSV